jgi:hypothetical protein
MPFTIVPLTTVFASVSMASIFFPPSAKAGTAALPARSASPTAFAKPYVSISLGPVKRLLGDVCNLKTNPRLRHSFYHVPDLSVEDIGRLGTVALAEKELAAIVKPWPCPKQSQIVIEAGIPCPEVEDAPGELFLCFQPDGNCQRIPSTPSTPICSLSECYGLGRFLSQTSWDPFAPKARFVVRGAGAWYECRKETAYDVLKEKLGPQLGQVRSTIDRGDDAATSSNVQVR